MLFKLSIKNIRKSIKDYAVYFLTLILGIAIFYMFNSLDSQKAMLAVNDSTAEIVELLVTMVAWASVFVAVVLGFLIVYANNFLIKRRKKEFGLYMMLGMGKRQISNILLFETIFIGLLSLVVGMFLGVFGSQLMSILVAKLFKADMSKYEFVFSKAACLKTCLYFGVMYIVVMLFNTVTISKYKLIDLLTAIKKNEKVKMKNPFLCVAVFLVAAVILGYAYYQVTAGINQITTVDKLSVPVMMGVAATFLIFWSLSGFVLKIVQSRKNIYLRGTNLFVLRQIHNRINTTVVSMTIICLLLFMTVSVLSTALSLNYVLTKDLEEMTPVDINLDKIANLPDNGDYTKEQIADSKLKISDTLKNNGFDLHLLKDVIEVNTYATNELTWRDSLGSTYDEAKKQFPMLMYDTAEEIIKLSDYNKIAKLYGIEQYELKDDEYIVLCNFINMKKLRDMALATNNEITIAGKTYVSRYKECQEGYIEMATSHANTGIILVPDSCGLTEDMKEGHYLIANYNADTEEEKQRIDRYFINSGEGEGSELFRNIVEKGIQIEGITKNYILEASVGIATVITFIGIYLGVIFLIASSAILALKELTENSDNRQRYTVLRKIGVDEGMINQSLFRQIGIFFLVPLVLAVIHSVFGIQFALKLASVEVEPKTMLPSVIATAVFLVVVYGGYFFATYEGSKNMISEE
ncbi:MAG: ABC transporter permease [Lachnospiraceae bacterium]|nr:ABC transporter permease [Lachnospiraceae bacterium]